MDRKHGVLGAAAVAGVTALLAVVIHRRRKAKEAAASNKLVSSRGERLNLPGPHYCYSKTEHITESSLSVLSINSS